MKSLKNDFVNLFQKSEKFVGCNQKMSLDTQETIQVCYNKTTQPEEVDSNRHLQCLHKWSFQYWLEFQAHKHAIIISL